MKRCIITYAAGAHEELLDVALPTYKEFAERHGYDLQVSNRLYTDRPPAWNKIPLMLSALDHYEEVVWFDCDLVIVDNSSDFPPIGYSTGKLHAMVRHFDRYSEVPNSGVWRMCRSAGDLSSKDLLRKMMCLDVFTDHGWWEQAALMTLMGYTVPPQGSHFPDTKCKCVYQTKWFKACDFMRLCWNSHPNYRAERPKVVHCSYPDMQQRIEVMRALVRDPYYDYPRFDVESNLKGKV